MLISLLWGHNGGPIDHSRPFSDSYFLSAGGCISLVMPLSTRLPLLVAAKIILLWDVPMRTNPYAALAAGERCE